MAEKKKGRAKGSKVESYTYRTSWKADADGMALLKKAQMDLKGAGYSTTQAHLIDLAVQHYMSKLSVEELVAVGTASLAAEHAAREAKRLESKRKKIEAQQKKLAEKLKLLGA
jgi:hypothetical protein